MEEYITKRRYLVAAAILAFAPSASVCSGKTTSVTKTTTVPVAEAFREQDSKEQTSKKRTGANLEEENASNTPEGVLIGIVDVSKGLMITVISDKDSEPHVFGLDEKQSETYKGIKPGDTVPITHTNSLSSPDNMDTVVIDIEVG